jgi:hypothetical protein
LVSPISTANAAYHVVEDIVDYELGSLKKELSMVSTKMFMMNEIFERQNG